MTNLDRIPGSGDETALTVLRRVPKVLDGEFFGSLDDGVSLALGRFGARAPSLALRAGSDETLRDGLLATAISAAATEDDDRDVMIGLALHYDCAQRLGQPPAPLFAAVANRLGDERVAALLRAFGARNDVTLGSFGWQLVETPDGADYTHGPVTYRRSE